jgi:hypothetical protein
MIRQLLIDIRTQLRDALSAQTTHVHYDHLPNKKLLSEFCCTFEVQNNENINTFDTREAVKGYALEVKLNNPTEGEIIDAAVFIKNAIYGLMTIDSSVAMVTLDEEDFFFNSEVTQPGVWQGYFRFNLQCTD